MENVYNGDKKIGEKKCRVWYGVKRIIEEEEGDKLNEDVLSRDATSNS